MSHHVQWPPKIYYHKGRNQDRIRVAGRDYYLGPHGSPESRQRYAELVGQLAAAGRAERTRRQSKARSLTVAEVLDRWRRDELPRYAGRTEGKQLATVAAEVERLRGDLPAHLFDADALEELQLAFAQRQCARVVNRNVVRVRTIWRWLERRKLVPPGAWSSLRLVKPLLPNDGRVRHRPRVQGVTSAEALAVVRCCRSPAVKAMLLVQWWTGCRPNEVRGLLASEVGEDRVWRPRQHKNAWRGQSRVIVLGPRAWAALRPWLEAARADGRDVVFPNQRGQPYSANSYAQAAARAAQRAGVEGFRPYRLRHGAKRRIAQALGLDAARAALGQHSLDTADRYDHGPDPQLAAEAARRCG